MDRNTTTQSQHQPVKSKMKRKFLKMKIGISVEGKLYWLQESTEKVLIQEMITITTREQPIHSNVCLTNIYVTNHGPIAKEVTIFLMHYHENLLDDQFTFVSPSEKVFYHLANGSVFLVNGQIDGVFMNEYSVQPIWHAETNEFWTRKQNGSLRYQPMYRGPACSIFSIPVQLPGFSTAQGNTWVITGDSKRKLDKINQFLANKVSL